MWILRRFSKDGFSAQFLTQRFSRSFSKDFPPIFRNVEVWLVQKFQINFSIFTHFMRNFGSMSYNVLQIGDGRAFQHKSLFGELNFRLPQNCQAETKPRLLPMCCYRLGFFCCRCVSYVYFCLFKIKSRSFL